MSSKTKLAIIGSRDFTDYKIFLRHVSEWIGESNSGKQPSVIVSGGARGADAMAERYAKEHDIETEIYKPNLSIGKRGYAVRNQQIVDACTHVLAFPAKHGKGTQMTIRMAQREQRFAKDKIKIVYCD